MLVVQAYIVVSSAAQKQALLDGGVRIEPNHIFWPRGKHTVRRICDTMSSDGFDVIYSVSKDGLTYGCPRYLAAFGRWLELGSAGEHNLKGLSANATFSSIDLCNLAEEKPAIVARYKIIQLSFGTCQELMQLSI